MKQNQKEELKLGDKVMTGISTFAGEITEIKTEFKKGSYGSEVRSEPPVYTYKVRLPFQRINQPDFINKLVIFGASELSKI